MRPLGGGDEAPARRPSVVIMALAVCGTLVSVMQTLVIPLLPRYPDDLDTSAANVTWLVTATLLSGAVCAPILGRLGDMYGRRRMLVVALGVLATGSFLGAVAQDLPTLLVARTLQGASLGIVPLAVSIIRDLLPPDRIGSGIAWISSSIGLGSATGLVTAALVVQHFGWHWLFFGAGVIAVLDIVLVLVYVAESPHRAGGRFDAVGGLGLGVALLCLLLVISRGEIWGWVGPENLVLLAAAVLVVPLWARHQLRAPNPMVNLRLSASRPVLMTNLAAVLVGYGVFTVYLVTAPMLQAPEETGYGFDLSLVQAGLWLIPMGATMFAAARASVLLTARCGARVTLAVGCAVMGAASLVRAGSLEMPLAGAVAVVAIVVAGGSMAIAALPVLIVQAVPEAETAAASSLNALWRTIGTASCSAVMAAFTTAHTVDLGGATWPSETAYVLVFVVSGTAAFGGFALALANPSRHDPELLGGARSTGSGTGPRPIPLPAR